MNSIILYTTLDCHLCEQALVMIEPLLNQGLELQAIDISESNTLIESYGLRIPVLVRADTGAELGWPFDANSLLGFLA